MIKETHLIFDYLDTDGKIIRSLVDGPVTAGEIYRVVSASQPVVSKKLARLQDEGIIESRRDAKDRRVVWYSLTETFMIKLLSEPDAAAPGEPVSFSKRSISEA